ncbi:hypothetical protein [Paracoccus laeviglucosivorans]|uniref:Uncharacterized protein n=1 Tax=Paracoccus laeviglucosivorans TaxID=1197861 RepID=A0A521FUW8_9RHOB|nr:hypothetical protein [Paracoccus laeviglucosivorans]SMO99926.1 hypothetical protein SAMN06265221_1524 [Paracoccus laeviglucosivorans]
MREPLPVHLREVISELIFAIKTGERSLAVSGSPVWDRAMLERDIALCKKELDRYFAIYEPDESIEPEFDAPVRPSAVIIAFPKKYVQQHGLPFTGC